MKAARQAKAQQAATARRESPSASGGEALQPPAMRRVPPELEGLPWDFAHAEFGVAATDFLVLALQQVLLQVQNRARPDTGSSP